MADNKDDVTTTGEQGVPLDNAFTETGAPAGGLTIADFELPLPGPNTLQMVPGLGEGEMLIDQELLERRQHGRRSGGNFLGMVGGDFNYGEPTFYKSKLAENVMPVRTPQALWLDETKPLGSEILAKSLAPYSRQFRLGRPLSINLLQVQAALSPFDRTMNTALQRLSQLLSESEHCRRGVGEPPLMTYQLNQPSTEYRGVQNALVECNFYHLFAALQMMVVVAPRMETLAGDGVTLADGRLVSTVLQDIVTQATSAWRSLFKQGRTPTPVPAESVDPKTYYECFQERCQGHAEAESHLVRTIALRYMVPAYATYKTLEADFDACFERLAI